MRRRGTGGDWLDRDTGARAWPSRLRAALLGAAGAGILTGGFVLGSIAAGRTDAAIRRPDSDPGRLSSASGAEEHRNPGGIRVVRIDVVRIPDRTLPWREHRPRWWHSPTPEPGVYPAPVVRAESNEPRTEAQASP